MALTKKQEDAVELLLAGRLTPAQIAAQLDISERSLRRWQSEAEFGSILISVRKELFKHNADHLLATAQGRLDTLLTLYREVMDRKDAVLAKGDILNIEHHRIYVSLVREVMRIEREIARTLGQDTPTTPPPVEQEERTRDISCLNEDERMIIEFTHHKLAEINPWMKSAITRQLTQYDRDLCARLVTKYVNDRDNKEFINFAANFGQNSQEKASK